VVLPACPAARVLLLPLRVRHASLRSLTAAVRQRALPLPSRQIHSSCYCGAPLLLLVLAAAVFVLPAAAAAACPRGLPPSLLLATAEQQPDDHDNQLTFSA
jgi:anti-sigma factor RsiW